MARERIDGVLLGSGNTTLRIIANNLQGTSVELWVLNQDTVNRGIKIYFVPQGQGVSDAYLVIETQAGNALRPGEARPFKWDQAFLDAGDFIVANPETASVISVSGGVLEEAVA